MGTYMAVGNELEKEPEQLAEAAAVGQDTEKQSYRFGGKEYSSVEELGKAYESANSELGKWTQRYGDLEKQHQDVSGKYAQWAQWWKQVEPLWGEDVEAVLQRKLRGQGVPAAQAQQMAQAQAQQIQQQAAQQQQPAEQYDFYNPQDVAKFKQAVAADLARHTNGQLAQVVNAMNQTFAQKEQWYQTYLQNHLSLLRRALEQKLQNPNFDVNAFMEHAARAIGGQIDPIELGQQLIDAQGMTARIESAKKDAYEQGKKDFEQETKNKKQEAAPIQSFSAPKFTMPTTPPGTRNGLHTLREKAAQTMAKKFGPGLFFGE